MQIAKLFASLGFQVDTSGLNTFTASIRQAKAEIRTLGKDVGSTANKFTNLKRSVDSVDSALNKVRGAGANTKIITSYGNMAEAVENVEKHLRNIASNQTATTKAIGKINSSVHSGVAIWEQYANAVNRARDALRQVRTRVNDLRGTHTSNINVNQRISTSTSPTASHQTAPSDSGGSMMALLGMGGRGGLAGGLLGLLRSSLPSLALAGGGATLGYFGGEMVKAGQDQTRMEMALQVSSKNLDEFNDALKYVRSEALRLGLSSMDLGKAFAQVNTAADGLSQDQKKKMFTGLNEYMMTMGLSPEQQKGTYVAMYQMFSKGRILQEEVNQLSERGFSQKVFQEAAMKAQGIKSRADYQKMQQAGKIDPTKVFPVYAEMLQKMVHESGAYQKMMDSSITKQNRFYESLKQLSDRLMDSGLDKWLGNFFEILTKLVNQIDYMIDGVKGLNEILKPLGLNVGTLILALGGMFFGFRVAIKAFGMFRYLLIQNTSRMGTFVAFLRGGFAGGIKMIVGRFGIWGAVIATTIGLLQKLSAEWQKKQSGQPNWIDFALNQLELLKWKALITIEDFKYLRNWILYAQNAFTPDFMKFSDGTPITPLTLGNRAGKSVREGVANFFSKDEENPSKPRQLPSYATGFGQGVNAYNAGSTGVPFYQLKPQPVNVTINNTSNGTAISSSIQTSGGASATFR